MRKAKIVCIILFVLLSILASCGEQTNSPSQDNHVCSFSSTWSKNDSKHWKECSCGKKSEEANHSFGEWQVKEQATTTKEGLKEQTCSICSYKKQEKINKVNPIYSWKTINLLQQNIIMGGTSNLVLDENGNKVEYAKLADRQLDMLAQEIISRLEYVYGDTNKNETHNIIDNLNNKPFTTYNSMNVFSDSLSTKYAVYDRKDNYIEQGYIMLDMDGKEVEYDEENHYFYITKNNKKYAAVCSQNVNGIFTSPTSLQSTFEALHQPTISHQDNSYNHEGILTFKGAIYGTPTWEYEEKPTSIETNYEFYYNRGHKTAPWNWTDNFANGTAVKRLKNYLTYIACNNIQRYSELADVTITATQIVPTDNIYVFPAYLMVENNLIYDLIINEIIGTSAYNGDKSKGDTAEHIANAIYVTSQKVDTSESKKYYNNGSYLQLYSKSLTDFNLYFINQYSNNNYAANDILKAREYKGYDVVINGILRQISNQSAYKSCDSLFYEQKNISSSISTSLEETELYLFFKSKTMNEVRICLNVPYTTEVKLVDKEGKEVFFTKESVDGKLALKINGSKLPNSSNFNSTILNDIQGYGATTTLEEKLKGLDFLKLTLYGVKSFTLTTEESIQIN